jgi:putative membrane protein
MVTLLTRFLAVVFALLLITEFVPGFFVDGFYAALVVALLLGLLNITVKPVLFILTLPINLITFGLFSFVLNALMLWFVATFVQGFTIEGFLPALLGAIILSLINWLLSKIV